MRTLILPKPLMAFLAFSTLSLLSLTGATYSEVDGGRGLSWDEVLELRYEYEERVKALRSEIPALKRKGFSNEDIAKLLHSKRRELGLKFKMDTPEYLQGSVYERNQKRYGDPLGPSIEYLQNQGKSWEEIIESATRPGGGDLGADVFYSIGSFVHWFKQWMDSDGTSKKVGEVSENWP